MGALLRFCQSMTGQFVLGLLFIMSTALLQFMLVTTALRWFIRFVKDSWG